MKRKFCVITLGAIIIFVIGNLLVLFTDNSRYALLCEVITLMIIIVLFLLFLSFYQRYKMIKVLEKQITDVLLEIKTVIDNLKRKNKSLALLSIDKLLNRIICHSFEVNKMNLKNKAKLALINYQEVIFELNEFLYDIYSDLENKHDIITYQDYLVSHIKNNDLDCYENNAILLEDYIDLILINLYPSLTLKSEKEFLKYAKRIQEK